MLECFFDDESHSGQFGSGFFYQIDDTLGCIAVGEKVVDDEDVIVRREEFFADDDVAHCFVGEGFDARVAEVAVEVEAFAFLCENDGRVIEMLGADGCDADAGCFDGEDFVNGRAGKTAGKFGADLVHKGDVDLVIEEAVDFEHVARLDGAVFQNALL